jgi:hypothetical protein
MKYIVMRKEKSDPIGLVEASNKKLTVILSSCQTFDTLVSQINREVVNPLVHEQLYFIPVPDTHLTLDIPTGKRIVSAKVINKDWRSTDREGIRDAIQVKSLTEVLNAEKVESSLVSNISQKTMKQIYDQKRAKPRTTWKTFCNLVTKLDNATVAPTTLRKHFEKWCKIGNRIVPTSGKRGGSTLAISIC